MIKIFVFSLVCLATAILARILLFFGFGIEVEMFGAWWWGITFVSGMLGAAATDIFD